MLSIYGAAKLQILIYTVFGIGWNISRRCWTNRIQPLVYNVRLFLRPMSCQWAWMI